MKIRDPRALPILQQKDEILFAYQTRQGGRDTQEDFLAHFQDECFALADGLGGVPHGEVAAQLASETAVWAYKHVRIRPYYWDDKRLFMKRIFRSSNLTVWQKRREDGFGEGLATTLLVVMLGPRSFWVGSAGDTSAFLYRSGKLLQLTHPDRDPNGMLTKALGFQRLGLAFEYHHVRFLMGDAILMVTDGVRDVMTDEDLARILGGATDTQQSFTETLQKLLDHAQAHGSTDNMTACLIKRIPAAF